MAYSEEDIRYENDVFTVIHESGVHKVLVNCGTYATSVMAFAGNADGLRVAKAWVDYTVKHSNVEAVAKLANTYTSTILALRSSTDQSREDSPGRVLALQRSKK